MSARQQKITSTEVRKIAQKQDITKDRLQGVIIILGRRKKKSGSLRLKRISSKGKTELCHSSNASSLGNHFDYQATMTADTNQLLFAYL